jgi:translation initiation factor IF-2
MMVMPQTIEAITSEGHEYMVIVAINKIDKADPARLDVDKRN